MPYQGEVFTFPHCHDGSEHADAPFYCIDGTQRNGYEQSRSSLYVKGIIVFKVILTGISGTGLWLFLKNGIVNYITFQTHFAFLDDTTAKWLIILQNLAMLLFFVLAGCLLSEVTIKKKRDL